jgi:hypothetical protein
MLVPGIILNSNAAFPICFCDMQVPFHCSIQCTKSISSGCERCTSAAALIKTSSSSTQHEKDVHINRKCRPNGCSKMQARCAYGSDAMQMLCRRAIVRAASIRCTIHAQESYGTRKKTRQNKAWPGMARVSVPEDVDDVDVVISRGIKLLRYRILLHHPRLSWLRL